MTSWRPSASLAALRARAGLLARARSFLAGRGVLEVEVPLLQGGANLDHEVAPFAVDTPDGPRWLITSPEHPLKRLVAAGCGDVYALTPVFRRGESGTRHAPAFTMLEWYRSGWDDRRLCAETIDLLRHLTGLDGAVETLSFDEALRRHAGVGAEADAQALAAALEPGQAEAARGDAAVLLDLVFSLRVQPRLGEGRWTVVDDWPADRAAQARLRPGRDGRTAAARFEVFRSGLELANGYHELREAGELRARLAAEAVRQPGAALDERFLAAMAHGLGDCAGVAMGFDRVVMLALGERDISRVQAFGWDKA